MTLTTEEIDTAGRDELEPGVMPIVEVHTSLSQLVDYIDVDATYFARLMASKGMSETEISATTIILTADSPTVDQYNDAEDVVMLHGRHRKEARSLTLHLGNTVRVLDELRKEKLSEGNPVNDETLLDEIGSEMVSEDAVHEISHRIDTATGSEDLEVLDYYGQLVPEKLIWRILRRLIRNNADPKAQDALELLDEVRKDKIIRAMAKNASYNRYENAPWEVRARDLAEEERKSFEAEDRYPITVIFKKKTSQAEATKH